MATKKILFQDFYKTIITETIPDSGDINFEVGQAPVNSYGFIIINPESSSLRERMFYHNVIGNRIYVRGVNRYSPKEHLSGSTIQINDSALIFNFLSEMVATTFFVEKLGGLNVKIWGGPILLGTTMSEISDTDLLLENNTLNYVYYNINSNTVEVSSSLSSVISASGIIQAEITTSAGGISEINYRKYSIIKGVQGIPGVPGTPGTPGTDGTDGDDGLSAYQVAVSNGFIGTESQWLSSLKGEPGDIGNPTETGQYIEDTIVVNTSTHTVTTNNSTFVKITENATGNYVGYNLTGRVWASSSDEVSNHEVVTGTWGAVGSLQGITYTDGLTIDTDGTVRYTGQPAYRDKENEFIGVNTFNNTTIFKENVSFPYYRIDMTGKTDILFDTSKGTKQRTINLTTTGSKTLSFDNLVAGANYELAIVNNSGGNITLGKGTISNSDTITKFYSLGGTTYPLTLSAGVHLFVMDTFDTAVHISYVGQSVEI